MKSFRFYSDKNEAIEYINIIFSELSIYGIIDNDYRVVNDNIIITSIKSTTHIPNGKIYLTSRLILRKNIMDKTDNDRYNVDAYGKPYIHFRLPFISSKRIGSGYVDCPSRSDCFESSDRQHQKICILYNDIISLLRRYMKKVVYDRGSVYISENIRNKIEGGRCKLQ